MLGSISRGRESPEKKKGRSFPESHRFHPVCDDCWCLSDSLCFPFSTGSFLLLRGSLPAVPAGVEEDVGTEGQNPCSPSLVTGCLLASFQTLLNSCQSCSNLAIPSGKSNSVNWNWTQGHVAFRSYPGLPSSRSPERCSSINYSCLLNTERLSPRQWVRLSEWWIRQKWQIRASQISVSWKPPMWGIQEHLFFNSMTNIGKFPLSPQKLWRVLVFENMDFKNSVFC